MEPESPDTPSNLPVDTNQHQPLKITEMYPVKKSHKKLIIIITTGLVVVIIGIVAFTRDKKSPQSSESSNNVTQTAPVVVEKDVDDSTKTKEYENGFLGIKLSHPANWTAVDTQSNGVRIESPDFSYQTLNKGEVAGNFRIYIRKGARSQDSKYIGRGYAIQPSETLAYSKPALGQRSETFLTIFGLDTPDNFAYFFIAGNYNLIKGDTLGPDYGKEPDTYIISGGFSAKGLEDDMATNTVSADLIKTSNAYKQAVVILKSLQLR